MLDNDNLISRMGLEFKHDLMEQKMKDCIEMIENMDKDFNNEFLAIVIKVSFRKIIYIEKELFNDLMEDISKNTENLVK